MPYALTLYSDVCQFFLNNLEEKEGIPVSLTHNSSTQAAGVFVDLSDSDTDAHNLGGLGGH